MRLHVDAHLLSSSHAHYISQGPCSVRLARIRQPSCIDRASLCNGCRSRPRNHRARRPPSLSYVVLWVPYAHLMFVLLIQSYRIIMVLLHGSSLVYIQCKPSCSLSLSLLTIYVTQFVLESLPVVSCRAKSRSRHISRPEAAATPNMTSCSAKLLKYNIRILLIFLRCNPHLP
jgi:hypothetical protein